MSLENAKKAAAEKAAELIQNDMIIGLGSGSTAQFFIEKLGSRCHQGLKIHAVATSKQSEMQAKNLGIPLLDASHMTRLDLTIDGADEIDPQKRMIKGGGGALVREKILASMSKEMIVIIDETKKVDKLGKRSLPVEVVPFGCMATQKALEKLGYHVKWRLKDANNFYMTDNHNYILDIHFDHVREHPELDHLSIKQIPGVVDTGFFFKLAGRVIVGFLNGKVVIQS